MNILLVSSKFMPEYSGSGFRAQNLYKRLCTKHKDIELEIICGSETENSSGTYEHEGFKINRIAAKPYPVLKSGFLRKLQILRNFQSEFNQTLNFLKRLEKQPDIIHIFGQTYVTAAALHYACTRRIPVLIELCNEMENPHHYIPFPFNQFLYVKPSHEHIYVCISERLRQVCLRYGINDDNIWCRPNPINEEIFQPAEKIQKYDLRKRLTKFGEDKVLLTYIAKYIERKNHIFLLDVIKKLPEKFVLFLGGPLVETGPNLSRDGNLFDTIKTKIASEELEERVQLESGFTENIEEFYKASDIYLFPTKEEGLGTPLIENVACAVPVIANIIPGITDVWIKDGQNGYLSELDSEIFMQNILKAVDIPRDTLLKESSSILEKAGHTGIDKKYMEIMRKMIPSREINKSDYDRG